MPFRATSEQLPRFTIDTLPGEFKTTVLEHQYIKFWELCVICGEFGRYRCGRCGNITHRDGARYCSKKCQREHWARHREGCNQLLRDELSFRIGTLTVMTDKEYRQGFRWMWALLESILIPTTARQASRIANGVDLPKSCLHIVMTAIDGTHPRSPLRVVSFEWTPVDFDTSDPPMPINPFERQNTTHCKIILNGSALVKERITLAPEGQSMVMDGIIPQWPWIFGQCAAMGDIDPEICTVRLGLLYSTAVTFGKGYPLLEPFKVKMRSNKVEVSAESFDAWMKLMYPVTSAIGSRFHPPCDVVSRRYGHQK